MPVPKPQTGEEKDKFISRCMRSLTTEYPREQAYAICIKQWDDK